MSAAESQPEPLCLNLGCGRDIKPGFVNIDARGHPGVDVIADLGKCRNKRLPFKAFFRAVVLLPFIVPTALSALAFWWIYDAQFSVISWALTRMGLIHRYIDFLGDPWNARFATIAANIWRGVPFVAITLLAGLQTISPSYYEAAS